METSLIAPHRGKETSGGLALINLRFYRASPDRLGDCPLTAHADIAVAMRKGGLGTQLGKDAASLLFIDPAFGVTVG
jgi:hypothetical protein